jgi:hypothetical protein
MTHKIAHLLGIYFVAYTIIYLLWNYFVQGIGFAEYQIPGFWIGMAGFALLNAAKNIIKGK